jgi:hypothetical protein
MGPPDPLDDPEHLQLRLGIQPVTAFDFEGSGSQPECGQRMLLGHGKEPVLGSRSHGSDGGQNASSAAKYFKVFRSLEPQDKLVLAPSRKTHVGVRVDETRDDGIPPAVHFLIHIPGPERRQHALLIPNGGDQAAFCIDGPVGDMRHVALVLSGKRDPRVGGGKNASVPEQFSRHIPSTSMGHTGPPRKTHINRNKQEIQEYPVNPPRPR